jgi:hypothetical protein
MLARLRAFFNPLIVANSAFLSKTRLRILGAR